MIKKRFTTKSGKFISAKPRQRSNSDEDSRGSERREERREFSRPRENRFGRARPSDGQRQGFSRSSGGFRENRERRGPPSFQKPSGPLMQIKKFNAYEREFDRKNIYTKNLTPGKTFFSEQLITDDGEEYRTWDASRSKLAAGIKKGLSQIGLKEGDSVLYLGASHGFTPSFVSDMIGPNGSLFCLDVAPRVVRDLVFVCEARENMAPLLADANHPEQYKELIAESVDVVFQDISQRNQVQIFLKNCDAYLKQGGFGLLALKARSIDVAMNPRDIYTLVRKQLEEKITIVDSKELDPFERDHMMFVCKKK